MSYSFVNRPAVRFDIINATDYYKNINPNHFFYSIVKGKTLPDLKCSSWIVCPNPKFSVIENGQGNTIVHSPAFKVSGYIIPVVAYFKIVASTNIRNSSEIIIRNKPNFLK